MKVEWDEEKRKENLRKHGFDFADARHIFDAPMLTRLDTREDYSENRFIGIGFLRQYIVVLVFTERDYETVRVISMRKALKHERKRFEEYLRNRLETN